MRQRPLILTLMLAGAAGAWAQGALPDPTKPPAAAAQAPEAGKPAAGPAGSGLSSVILRKGARPAAVIDGQYVELGGKVGERRVVRITESEAVLRSAEGKETLPLTPGVEKQLARKKAAGKATASGGGR